MTSPHEPVTESGISRRQFTGGMLGVAASALLYGCGKGSSSSGGNDDEITFLNDASVKDTPFDDALKAFEKDSGITVKVQPVPSEYDTKFRTVLSSGTPPDLIKINDDYVKGISTTGALLDLTPYIEKDKMDASQYPAELYDFPKQPDGTHTSWVIAHSPRLFFYNVDAFKDAGIDLPPTTWTGDGWTWDDFLETAKALTIPDERWGALVYLDTGYEQTWSVNNGSSSGIYSTDGKTLTLADPPAVEALQWATDLTCEHEVQPNWGDLQSTNADLQLFAQGKLAMMFSQFSTTPYLLDNATDFEWDVTPPPAGKADQRTESSVITYAIPQKAQNPDGAWELLKFLTSVEGGKIFVEGNMWLPMDKRALTSLKQPPAHAGLFADAVEHSTLPNQTTDTLGARQIYRPALDEAYNCQKPVDEVLSSVKSDVEETLNG